MTLCSLVVTRFKTLKTLDSFNRLGKEQSCEGLRRKYVASQKLDFIVLPHFCVKHFSSSNSTYFYWPKRVVLTRECELHTNWNIWRKY